MAPWKFEPAIPESDRPQTHALDRAATGIGARMITLKPLMIWGKLQP